jgi:hypothetical protein
VLKSFYSVLGCNDGFHFIWKCLADYDSFKGILCLVSCPMEDLTMDNIRWHVIMVDRCCVCKKNESIGHLYFEVACAIYNVFFI